MEKDLNLCYNRVTIQLSGYDQVLYITLTLLLSLVLSSEIKNLITVPDVLRPYFMCQKEIPQKYNHILKNGTEYNDIYVRLI